MSQNKEQLVSELQELTMELEQMGSYFNQDGVIDAGEQEILDEVIAEINHLKSELKKIETTHQSNNSSNSAGQNFDFNNDEMEAIPQDIQVFNEKLNGQIDELGKLVKAAAEEAFGKNAGEMTKDDQKAIQDKLASIKSLCSDIQKKYKGNDFESLCTELINDGNKRLNEIEKQLAGIKVPDEPIGLKLGTGKTNDHTPKDELEEGTDSAAGESKDKKDLKETVKNEKTRLVEQKEDLKGYNDLKKELENTKDPEKKAELEQKLKDKEDEFEKKHGSKPKTVTKAAGRLTSGLDVNFDSKGLSVSGNATVGVGVTVKPPSIPIPALASELAIEFGLDGSISGAISALLDLDLLTKIATAKNLFTGPIDYDTAVFLVETHGADLGKVQLSGSIESKVEGTIEISLTIAKLLKLSVKGALTASFKVGVSAEFTSLSNYVLGSVDGGIVLGTSASIGPSDEVQSVISNDLIKKLTVSIPLTNDEFFVIKTEGNATYSDPKALFKNVKFSEGKALINMKKKMEEVYDDIMHYVCIVGDAIEAVGDYISDTIDDAGKVVDGLNELRTFDQMKSIKFQPKRASKTYLYNEKMEFEFYLRMSGKFAANFDNYDIKVELELFFNGKRIDWIEPRLYEDENGIDDAGGSLSKSYYVWPKGFNAKYMKELYNTLGESKFRQAVKAGVFVAKGYIHVDGVANVVAQHRLMVIIPDDFDFSKAF